MKKFIGFLKKCWHDEDQRTNDNKILASSVTEEYLLPSTPWIHNNIFYLLPSRHKTYCNRSNMPSIVSNVHFDTIAREWRCKWESEEALVECQTALNAVLDSVKATKGVKNVQRVVCGGCKDFKVGNWDIHANFLKRSIPKSY